MATRTRKQTPAKPTAAKTAAAKKTPARKPAAKKALPKAPVNKATVVDIRTPLPVRRRLFVGPMGASEQAAVRAALAAAKAALRVPVSAWHGPTAVLADDTVLTHTPAHATTDQTATFTAAIHCPHGAIHPYTIHTAQELQRARLLTAQCNGCTKQPDDQEHPKPEVRALGDALTRVKTATADTQPMDTAAIAAGLEARAADTPKEHPEP